MPDAILLMYRPFGPIKRDCNLQIAQVAHDYGYDVVCLAPEGSSPPPGPDHYYYADMDQPQSVRAAVRKICQQHHLRHIFPLFEGEVYTAALCREDNDIPGLRPEQAILFRDKNAMHARAAELGINVPRSCQPHTLGTVEAFIEQVGYPVIIKPYDGWACRSTYRVDSADELAQVWRTMRNERHDYRVEQFIHGSHFHVDSLLQNNDLVFNMLSQYTYSIINYKNEPGGTISRRHDLSPLHQKILACNARLLAGFDLRTGVTHAEFFLTEQGEVYLGEVAARIGGGSIVPAVRAGCGLHLAREWCKIELDPNHRPQPTNGPETGTEYLNSPLCGTITHISSDEDLLALDSVVDAQVWKKVGDGHDPSHSADVLGYYVCQGESFEAVRAKFRVIRDHFKVAVADAPTEEERYAGTAETVR